MLKKNDIIYDDKKEKYKILNPIGRGGMGYVLLVERLSDHQQFAVKTLPIYVDGDIDHKALMNEASLAQKINHINVISYTYFHDGTVYSNLPPYIIMELADKENLADMLNEHIESNKLIEQDDLIALYNKLIDGMEAINNILIHRDIKPTNILFKSSELKISDFGISKIAGDSTRTKSFKGSGTLAFLPPEVFLNQKNTIQMDIYSMGIVFYMLATLKHPYEIKDKIKSEDEWKNSHLSVIPVNAKLVNPGISPKISGIIQKMLEKNPSKRFSTWAEIREELKTIDIINQSPHSSLIEKMVSKNSQKKTAEAQKEAELTKKLAAEKQKNEMILYQFKNDIVAPIEEFIHNYNLANPSLEDQIKIHKNEAGNASTSSSVAITGPEQSFSIDIYIHIIDANDIVVRRCNDMFGDPCTELFPPTLNGKTVLAWGAVQERSGKGFNLILCQAEAEGYGGWSILKNSHSVLLSRKDNRPEPFPFGLRELKEEIHYVNAMHIYNTVLTSFEPNQIIEFISEF